MSRPDSASRVGTEATPLIRSFPLGDYETNCFIVTVPDAERPEERRDAWIVDLGQRPGVLLDTVAREGLKIRAMLFTHAHADHIAGVDEGIRRLGADVPRLAHPLEAAAFEDPQLNLSAFIAAPISMSPPTGAINDGDTLELAGTRWRVMHTPGHSPGGVTLFHAASGQAIVGDTLFAGSIGRTDFPTSDPGAMWHSLTTVLMGLPDEVRVFPGHGPTTTIGAERRSNPFLRPGTW
ncbi:MAG: MBL fold metallo-hydrolase [Phycisphaeraceae bacterium]|nr:MBL fold metallo-hydrolase [Phycisphaeraceae bacterium]